MAKTSSTAVLCKKQIERQGLVHNKNTKVLESVVEFFKTFLKDKRQMVKQGRERETKEKE